VARLNHRHDTPPSSLHAVTNFGAQLAGKRRRPLLWTPARLRAVSSISQTRPL